MKPISPFAEFKSAESAKRGVTRKTFNELVALGKAGAKRENLHAILSHTLEADWGHAAATTSTLTGGRWG